MSLKIGRQLLTTGNLMIGIGSWQTPPPSLLSLTRNIAETVDAFF